MFVIHIVRPPENVSSALETLFLSYLTETLCGQIRVSARVRKLGPFRGIESGTKTTGFVGFDLFG
jgi:hypothetical protein